MTTSPVASKSSGSWSAQTIVALSSGLAPAGVAIIRVSGPSVRFVLETICGEVPQPRKATLSDFREGNGSILDRGLALFFPGPASYTGEDSCEFHCHGGKAVVAAMLRRLSALPNCRLAEAGEFTRRALQNGKVDLLEAEALGDLIAAETEGQRRFAVGNTNSRQAELYTGWRRRLIEARALIEAELDFADETDVPGSVSDRVWQEMTELSLSITLHLAGFHGAEIVADGFHVVLYGAPNAGKSSLLNALARRDAAIVTDEPGTTRDPIEVSLDLGGYKLRVTDTAGIREAESKAEQMGIARSVEHAATADLVLHLIDLADPHSVNVPPGVEVLRIGTKSDIAVSPRGSEFDILISSNTGTGIETLMSAISSRIADAVPQAGDLLPWKQRHVDLLAGAVGHIDKAVAATALPLELRCEELREAGNAIGRLTGQIDVEDLLDVIFRQFCIGK